MNNDALKDILKEIYDKKQIERFVIDEIHCLPSWGKDFRNDYLRLPSIRTLFPDTPILGLTATATHKVVNELKDRLLLRSALVFTTSFNRKNLYYRVMAIKKKDRKDELWRMLHNDYRNWSGIVYTTTIKECEELSKMLKFTQGINCDYYHGKMEIEERNEVQKRWKNDQVQVIIATIAFGMGVDKKDVRFVIHMSLPKSLDGYIQEGGRAGRDHELSHVVMFYEYNDRNTQNWFIKNNEFSDQEREEENKMSLYHMLDYAEDQYEWRRVLQLSFLDENFQREIWNQMCDNWRAYTNIMYKDFSDEAKFIWDIIEEVVNTEGKQITLKYLLKILTNGAAEEPWEKKSSGKKEPSKLTKEKEINMNLNKKTNVNYKVSDPIKLNKCLESKVKARLSSFSISTIRRLLIKMLQLEIIKERLNKFPNNPTIAAYITYGRNFYSCIEGQVKVVLSTGFRRERTSRRSIKIANPPFPKKPNVPLKPIVEDIDSSSEDEDVVRGK
jgi:RecQ family ATP-dependent DNA helicase